MRKGNQSPDRHRYTIFFLIALLVLVTDQLLKMWMRTFPVGHIVFQAGFIRIMPIRNTGAAFGLFPDHTFILTIISSLGVVLVLMVALFAYRYFPQLETRLNRVSLGLLLGGTAGNLIDRLFFGYVTDFVSLGAFPSFNIADASLDIGAIILVISILVLTRNREDSSD